MIAVVKEDAEPSIPDRLEAFTRKYPDRLAFKSKNEALTWDALNRTASRIARTILAISKSRERPIALLVGQRDSIIAGLGVLKTGGFFVPLNESHPRARNSYILNETDATLIVTDGKRLSLARQLFPNDRQIVNIEELDPSLSRKTSACPLSQTRYASSPILLVPQASRRESSTAIERCCTRSRIASGSELVRRIALRISGRESETLFTRYSVAPLPIPGTSEKRDWRISPTGLSRNKSPFAAVGQGSFASL